jgi:hypothetical protein
MLLIGRAMAHRLRLRLPVARKGTPRGCPCGGQARDLPLQNVFGCGVAARCYLVFVACWGRLSASRKRGKALEYLA